MSHTRLPLTRPSRAARRSSSQGADTYGVTISKLFLLPLLAAFTAATVYSQNYPEHKFLARAVDEYANRPLIQKELSKEQQKRYPNVSELRFYRFTSRLASSLDANQSPTLILMVYVYGDEARSTEGLLRLQVTSDGWKEKEPDFSFVDGKHLFRLIGSCLIPDKNWVSIKSELTDSVLGKGAHPEAVLSIECNKPREIVPLKTEEGPPTLRKRPPGDN